MILSSKWRHTQMTLKSWYNVDTFFFFVSVQMTLVLITSATLHTLKSLGFRRGVLDLSGFQNRKGIFR